MNYQVLLLDVSNIFFRSFCKVDFVNEAGTDLSGVYGSLNIIQSLIKQYSPTFIVAVFDGKKGSTRKKKIFPNYKFGKSFPINLRFNHLPYDQQLEYSKKAFLWQLKKFYEFICILPIYTVVLSEREADETLAYIKEIYFQDKNILIVSNDKDYHQLVTDRVHVKNEKEIITPEKLKTIWGTSDGKLITILRTIIGDNSDKINGIHGYQLKSIQNYFPLLFDKKIETIDDLQLFLEELLNIIQTQKKEFATNWKTIEKRILYILKGKDPKSELQHIELLNRNYKLMQLHDVDFQYNEMQQIANCMNEEMIFDPKLYKNKILEEGLTLQGFKSPLEWEIQFRDLWYNQTHNLVLNKK